MEQQNSGKMPEAGSLDSLIEAGMTDRVLRPDEVGDDEPLSDDEVDWEEAGVDDGAGGTTTMGWDGNVVIDTKGSTSTNKRTKPALRRATEKDKEFAEMVHKAHLLCLLSRGRIVDAACNDETLQASVVSVTPSWLALSLGQKPPMKSLGFLVNWFHSTFRVVPNKLWSSGVQLDKHECLPTQLQQALQLQTGSAEEIAGLSVALFRGLGFTTRYVSALDVAPLKPDAESLDASADWDPSQFMMETGIDLNPYMEMERKFASLSQILAQPAPAISPCSAVKEELPNYGTPHSNKKVINKVRYAQIEGRGKGRGKARSGRGWSQAGHGQETPAKVLFTADVVVTGDVSGQKLPSTTHDKELERDLAMAIAATGAVADRKNLSISQEGESSANHKQNKGVMSLNHFSEGHDSDTTDKSRVLQKNSCGKSLSSVVWSKKVGPVLHWAEIYCDDEAGDGGKWVHVDVIRGSLNGADTVEAATAACRLPLCYAVAFAGSGAKDVTRRYVKMWSKIVSLRVNEEWWDDTLRPLRQLEAIATSRFGVNTAQSQIVFPVQTQGASMTGGRSSTMDECTFEMKKNVELSNPVSELNQANKNESLQVKEQLRGFTGKVALDNNPFIRKYSYQGSDQSALEDIEMETKTLTEPLPTTQLAYKAHHLYVLERWLTKYQTLHPKGPVLGLCAGQPVYPRTCVQTLHTPDRWLRKGFKVRDGEPPAKVVKVSRLANRGGGLAITDPCLDGEPINSNGTTALFGKWQTEPWVPLAAVNGIVPKNERGQVDVWSEKCIPQGTVHLRLPRLVPIVKLLGIDFAPAMVGFEIRKGKSFPVYEGIVVCEEFKDLILDAHSQEEERRAIQIEKKRKEAVANKWRQLLLSMSTRQRLKAIYEGVPSLADTT